LSSNIYLLRPVTIQSLINQMPSKCIILFDHWFV
jgi:hypothetical protein